MLYVSDEVMSQRAKQSKYVSLIAFMIYCVMYFLELHWLITSISFTVTQQFSTLPLQTNSTACLMGRVSK